MIQHKILLDPVNYGSKPDSSEIGKINGRIIKYPVEIGIVELSKKIVQPYGRTWIPAYLKGGRKNENWELQSIFALDFDGGITIEEALERLKDYGLDFTFAYSTFSDSSEHPKFRAVLQLDYPVIDKNERDRIQEALMILFPEADKHCKDPSRIFFGGKALIYNHYDYFLNVSTLIESARFHGVKNSSNGNMSRGLARIERNLGVGRNGSEKNTIHINNIDGAPSTSESVVPSPPSYQKIETIRGIDFEELRQKIRVLNDFMDPEIKLPHWQLLGIATNLRYIEGGQELYKKCITANPSYAQEEKLKIMHYCKSRNYYPMQLENFSDYREDWEYGNLINAARKKTVIRLHRRQNVSVEEARKELEDQFANILRSDDTCIHVIKAVTGIGKTELYKGLEDVLIALPYHSLKGEVAKVRMQVPCRETPSLDNLPKEVKDALDYYYSTGAYSWANQYLSEMSELYESVRNYQDECFSCYESGNTVLTTHQKAIFIPFWMHTTIIFDEDIMGSLLPISKVTMNDLLRLESSISNQSDRQIITSLVSDIREGRADIPKRTGMSVLSDLRAIEDEVLGASSKYESGILDFFGADFFVRDMCDPATIHYVRKYDLPKDKKIIILSATANETSYSYLFGDRLRFYDLGNVESVGLVEQDTKYSFSRSSFLANVGYAIEKVGNLPVITFAGFKSEFPNPVQEMHFGYCSGSDRYNGQDTAVVGTPHANPAVIALYATALGLPVKAQDFSRIRQQTVHHNGFRFWFNAYDNEYLRNIQFYFIESGLRQAIGRSRPYTTPSKVMVVSSYPLPEASIIGTEEQNLGRERLERNRKTYLEQCLQTPAPN